MQLTVNRTATRIAGANKANFKYQFVNTATGRECCASNNLMQLCSECRRAASAPAPDSVALGIRQVART